MTRAGRAPLPDGGWLAYDVDGDGPLPLLLLRPLGGSSKLWGPFRAALGRPTIAFDHRGTGDSSALPLAPTTRALAADATRLLDHLGVPRADVFGLSLGGMVGTWLAIDASDRVARLVLASTPARGVDLSVAGAGKALALARCLARPPAGAEACLARRVLSSAFRDAHPAEADAIARAARARPASRLALVGLVAASARHDVRAAARRVRAPTVILRGENDHLLSSQAAEHLARAIPGAAVRTILDAGHDLTLEAPLATAAAVDAFLAD